MLVLSIIGVIAALTIPGIVQNLNDKQLKTKWKKTYSDINQAFTLIKTDNDGTLASASSSSTTLKNLFQTKMHPLSSTNTGFVESFKRMDGTIDSYYSMTYGSSSNLTITSGSTMTFILDDGSCATPRYSSTENVCGWMLVDVNGTSPPNQWGKDVYGIWILNYKIIPWGMDPMQYGSATCPSSGYGCGALNLE